MKFKSLTLSIFLIPFTLFGNSTERIQELNTELSNKRLILSDMGKKIAKQEEAIESMIFKMSAIWESILAPLNEQEKKEFNTEISNFTKHTRQVLRGEKDSKQFLIQELFQNAKSNYALGRIKSWQIRIEVEWDIWRNLFEDYEKCLLEFFEIDRELDDLKKQALHN